MSDKIYLAFAPNGLQIVGTADTVPCTANISHFSAPNVDAIEWTGDTEVHWDGQLTGQQDGEDVFVDEDGNEWKESQLTFKEDSNEEAETDR